MRGSLPKLLSVSFVQSQVSSISELEDQKEYPKGLKNEYYFPFVLGMFYIDQPIVIGSKF